MWEERISRVTHPAILLEHVLRYRAAIPIVERCSVWADLGCGGGIAASRALSRGFGGCVLVVDKDPAALDEARDELSDRVDNIVPLSADLTSEEDLNRVAGELKTRGHEERQGCITCFEVVEHLGNFVPLLDLLRDATTGLGYTVILSVPNDAFWSMENPHHEAVWGTESLQELVRLLPEPRVVAHQFPLIGSSIVATGVGPSTELELRTQVSLDGVPSHYLVAFGPHAELIASPGEVKQGELDRQRSWERQREAHLSFLQQRELDLMWLVSQCEAELAKVTGDQARDHGNRRLGRGARISRAS